MRLGIIRLALAFLSSLPPLFLGGRRRRRKKRRRG